MSADKKCKTEDKCCVFNTLRTGLRYIRTSISA